MVHSVAGLELTRALYSVAGLELTRGLHSVAGLELTRGLHSVAGLSTCQQDRQRILGWIASVSIGASVPECKVDGCYSEMQCHDSTGLCWCIDVNGNEKPGSRVRGKAVCAPLGLFICLLFICSLLGVFIFPFFKTFCLFVCFVYFHLFLNVVLFVCLV